MKNKLIILPVLFLLFFAGSLYGQKIDTAAVVISGGNAVIIDIPQISSPNERIVSRSVNNGTNYQQIGSLKRPESFEKFRAIAGDTLIRGLKKLKKFSSDKELWNFIQSNPPYKDYSLAVGNIRFLKAIGWTYTDNTIAQIPAGTKLYYKITDQATAVTDTGSCITGPQPFAQKPRLAKQRSSDSLIYMQWGYKAKTTRFLPKYAYVYQKSATGTFTKQVFEAPASLVNDSVYFGLSRRVLPNKEYTYYLQPVDFFDNAMNVRSDTITMLSVNYKVIPPVQNVKAKDTVAGILLTWKKQQPSLFLSGVLIERSTVVNGTYTTVAIKALTDSTYLDGDVRSGLTYYYRLKVIGQKDNANQKNSFSGFASASHSDKHNKPDVPYMLTVTSTKTALQLKWKPVTTMRLAGYYVYRTNKNDTSSMELISRLVTDSTFIDSTKNKSRRLDYYYAVKAVNMSDVKSNYSKMVEAKLPVGVEKPLTPAYINLTRNGGNLLIEWQNTKLSDNYIKGYVLYKRKIQPGEHLTYDVNKSASVEASRLGFSPVSKTLLTNPNYEDVVVAGPDLYEYAVAATDFFGAESGLSALAVQTQAPVILSAPLKLIVIDINSKAELSWLQSDVAGLKGFNVYRKELNEKDFKKIASVGVKESKYTDATIQPQKVYMYKIKSVSSQGESKGSASNSLKVY